MLANKYVIVTGANKGIGFALVEKLLQHPDKPNVMLTSRNPILGKQAYETLLNKYPKEESRLDYSELDINSSSSIEDFRDWLADYRFKFDVLINNAAMGDARDIMMAKGYSMTADEIRKTVQTNFFSTVELTEALLPYLSPEGKIVTMSSLVARFGMQGKPINEFLSNPNVTKEQLFEKMKEFEELAVEGKHTEAGFSKAIYNVTKAFINAYTKSVLAPQMKDSQSCYVVYPGWCQTTMGGAQAPITAEQGTFSAMSVLEFDKETSKKNNGGFFDDKAKPIPY